MSTESVFRHDPRNRFEVANAKRATQLHHDADDAAQRRAEASRQADAKSARPRTAGGILLDAKTIEAKRDRDNDLAAGQAERNAPQHPPMSPATMESITRDWLAQNPTFYNSEFNRTSMRNFVRKNVEQNGISFGFELLDAAFDWLTRNDHLERDPAIPRRRGDVVGASAPEIFQYVPAEERESQQALARQVADSIVSEETARAKDLPFEELQREVKANRRPLTRQQAEAVVR